MFLFNRNLQRPRRLLDDNEELDIRRESNITANEDRLLRIELAWYRALIRLGGAAATPAAANEDTRDTREQRQLYKI